MSHIIVNLKTLIQEKAAREDRTLTMQTIAEETGLNYATVSNWVKNRVDRAELTTIATFCDYFGCDTGDLLLRMEEVEPAPELRKVVN
jgi:transcriptional regulator with XRE-family HTH domain